MRHGLHLVLLIALAAPAYADSQQFPQNSAPAAVDDARMPHEWEQSAEPNPEALREFTDLFPNGLPNLLTPESMATSYRFPTGVQPSSPRKLPTGFDVSHGPVTVDVGTKISAANSAAPSMIPALPDPNLLGGAAGGSGEIKGQVRYHGTAWEFYGTHKVGVTQADGAMPTIQENTSFGGAYKLPDWMAGGKLGASLELTPTDERKTRVEYRRPLGTGEGYVAAERVFVPVQPDQKKEAPASVRGGVSQKF